MERKKQVACIRIERKKMNWLMEEESGQGLVEYGLILALLVFIGLVGLSKAGKNLNFMFRDISDALGIPIA